MPLPRRSNPCGWNPPIRPIRTVLVPSVGTKTVGGASSLGLIWTREGYLLADIAFASVTAETTGIVGYVSRVSGPMRLSSRVVRPIWK